MNQIVCVNCKSEFEENIENKTEICPACVKKQKSGIQVFQTLKILAFVFALIVLSFFIPLSLARETSHGYHEMLGSKGKPVFITGGGIQTFKIVIVFLTIGLSSLGFWFGMKQKEKEEIYRNDDLSIK